MSKKTKLDNFGTSKIKPSNSQLTKASQTTGVAKAFSRTNVTNSENDTISATEELDNNDLP